MRLLYDSEGDVLDVIFDERLHRAEKAAYRLRDGIMLYLTTDSVKPIQLTLVHYRRFAELPILEFEGWQAMKASDKKRLSPILASPMISRFLKLDTRTGYGHLSSPDVLEMFSLAA